MVVGRFGVYRPSRNVRQFFFLSYISDFLVNYFLDILHQFIITNDYLHFSSYFRQSKILSDINGRRTLRGPTDVHSCKASQCIFQFFQVNRRFFNFQFCIQ